MQGLHAWVGLVALAVNGVAGIAGGAYLWRAREAHPLLGHAVALGQTLLVAQVALGLLLLSSDQRAPDRLHYLYGAFALGAVLSPWLYAPADRRSRLAWFAGASLLAAALAGRAYTTGR